MRHDTASGDGGSFAGAGRQKWVAIFWSALVLIVLLAVVPYPIRLPGNPSDKVMHIMAFVVITVLGSCALPQIGLMRLGLWLSFFSAVIAALQSLPFLHQFSDVWDWVADTAAVLVVLLVWRFCLKIDRRLVIE